MAPAKAGDPLAEVAKIAEKTLQSLERHSSLQSFYIDGIATQLRKMMSAENDGGEGARAMKEMMGALTKAQKLVEATTAVVAGIKLPKADGDGADQALASIDQYLGEVQDLSDQKLAAIDELSTAIDKATRNAGSGDKGVGKRAKAATAALDKAAKLIADQRKAVAEAGKALAA